MDSGVLSVERVIGDGDQRGAARRDHAMHACQ